MSGLHEKLIITNGVIHIASWVNPEGSASGVLDGRRYNRAVPFHKLMYEALQRLAWKGFQSWIEKFPEKNLSVQEFFNGLMPLYNDLCQREFDTVMKSQPYSEFIVLYDKYLDYCVRNSNGKLSTFWMSYLDIVEILLNLLRASREGDWELHLSAIKEMIPWCFAHDNLNHVRYLSAYVSEMSHLEEEQPEAFKYLKSGGFSVQIGEDNPFGKVPVDQACEETVNKDTQTARSTKEFSLKAGAVSKYYLVAEYRSIFLRLMKDMLDLNKSIFHHTDLQSTRIVRDETDVKSLVAMLQSHWLDPFSSVQQDLVCLSTGKVAPPKILLKLLERRHMKSFV